MTEPFAKLEPTSALTLRRWLMHEKPTQQRIIAVFARAGEVAALRHSTPAACTPLTADSFLVSADDVVQIHVSSALPQASEDALAEAEGIALRAPDTAPDTVFYAAPELTDDRVATPRSEQYALSAMLYEALLGRCPFPGKTAAETRKQAVRGVPDGPLAVVPRHVEIALRRGLSAEPFERYASLSEWVLQLRGERNAQRAAPLIAAGSIAALALAASVAYLLARPPVLRHVAPSEHVQSAACVQMDSELTQLWSHDVRAQLQAHFDTTAPLWGAPTYAAVLPALQSRVAATRAAQDEVCTRERIEPGEVRCASWRLLELRTLLEVLREANDPMVIAHSRDSLTALSLPESCAASAPQAWDDASAKVTLKQAIRFAIQGREEGAPVPVVAESATDLPAIVGLLLLAQIELATRSVRDQEPEPAAVDAALQLARDRIERALELAESQKLESYALQARVLRLQIRPFSRDFENLDAMTRRHDAPFLTGTVEATRITWLAQDGSLPLSEFYRACAADRELRAGVLCTPVFTAMAKTTSELDVTAIERWVMGAEKTYGTYDLAVFEAKMYLAELVWRESAGARAKSVNEALHSSLTYLIATSTDVTLDPPWVLPMAHGESRLARIAKTDLELMVSSRAQKAYELLARSRALSALIEQDANVAIAAEQELSGRGERAYVVYAPRYVRALLEKKSKHWNEAAILAHDAAEAAARARNLVFRARALALEVEALLALGAKPAKPEGELGKPLAQLVPSIALLPRAERVALRIRVADLVLSSDRNLAQTIAKAAESEATESEKPAIRQLRARIPRL